MLPIKYSQETSDIVDRVFEKHMPTQDTYEVKMLVEHLRGIQMATIVEIGIAGSGTMRLWSELAQDNANLIGVDIDPNVLRYKVKNKHQTIEYVIGDTTFEGTYRSVIQLLPGTVVDFLFIDGSHEYEIVKNDYNRFKDLVRPGGIIAFHDINNCSGPKRLFEEIRGQYKKSLAFINTEKMYKGAPMLSFGIGLLIKE